MDDNIVAMRVENYEEEGVRKMAEDKQKKRDERIGRIVSNVSQLPDEDQIYVLGHVEGFAAKKAIEAQKRQSTKGA